MHEQTVSRYDKRYFCSIRKVSRIGVDGVNVDFEVLGDGSLGPLQVWAFREAGRTRMVRLKESRKTSSFAI